MRRLEHRAIALREAKRALLPVRAWKMGALILFPLMAAWVGALLWSDLAAVGVLPNAILIFGVICVLSILRYAAGQKQLMRAIELNRDGLANSSTVTRTSHDAERDRF